MRLIRVAMDQIISVIGISRAIRAIRDNAGAVHLCRHVKVVRVVRAVRVVTW